MKRRLAGRPTLTQVAQEAGVSIATASYVVNNSTKAVADETRQRVLEAAKALGYVPNAAAATLRRGRSNVALVVVDRTYTEAVSARTIEYVSQGIRQAGFTMLVHTMENEDELLTVVAAVQPYGIGLLTFVSASTRERLKRLGVQLILGYESPPDGEEGDRFWERAIGAVQAAHLLDRGHSRLLYVMPPESAARFPVAAARLRGAVEECDRRGAEHPLTLVAPQDRERLAVALPAFREQGVTAACAHDDGMGLAVLAAMADLGWRAPNDLAVVGADNDVTSSLSQPPLTTVRIPDEGYAEVAANRIELAARGDVEAASVHELPEPTVIQRATT